MQLADKANEFSKIALYGKKRLNGEDAYAHCLRVKENLEKIGIADKTILASALLHSCVSKGNVNISEITKEFGDEISEIVSTLTVLSKITLPWNENLRTSALHDLFRYLAKDMGVLFIRLSDRVDNLKTSDCHNNKSRKEIAKKALYLYAPIARTIGLYSFTKEFETEAMKRLFPIEYKQIEVAIEKKLKRHKYILKTIKRDLEQYLTQNKIKHTLSYRIKSPFSIYQKAKTKFEKGDISIPTAYLELKDILGVRMIVETEDECYMVFGYMQEHYDIVQDEYDDYIKKPKPNGYKSLQFAIRIGREFYCEIQIRTYKIHENNEYGAASHFQYKSKDSNTKSAKWLKEIIKSKDKILNGTETVNHQKLFVDELYVFTPDNDLIRLQKNSTIIDFAYAIHTDVGNHTNGAKIDGKLVPLTTKLISGQTIEIITSKNKKPSKDWLNFVKTKEAKKQIKSFFSDF